MMLSIPSVSVSIILLLLTPSTNAFAAKTKARSSGGGGFGASTNNPLTHTPDTSDDTMTLLQFLKANKAKMNGVEIGTSLTTGFRGMFATQNFKKGAFLCQIPSDCALALSDPSKNGEDAPTMAHCGANFMTMYSHNPEAKKMWAPYLNTLPQTADQTPDFFDDEELELLEFPRAIRLAKKRREEIAQVASEQGLSKEDLQFATWLASSRAFSINIATESEEQTKAMLKEDTEAESAASEEQQGEKVTIVAKAATKSIPVMVPFIDMANHNSDQPNAKLTLIDPEKDEAWFALEATRPIKAGKEIVISYGTGVESSVELLLNYGFVPQRNPIDEFMLDKGGEDTLTKDGWTTTLEEDQSMLGMAEGDPTLNKILKFRIRLKESYV